MSSETNKYNHRDLFGRFLYQGDSVAVNPPYYKGLVKAVIVGFSPKQVRVKVLDKASLPDRSSEEFSVYPINVCLGI